VYTICCQDETIPAGSHVLLVGLADGRFLWEGLHDKYYPLGTLNKDIDYPQVYQFLTCLGVNRLLLFVM